MKPKKSLDNFISAQLSQWPLARDNYRALKNVSVRTLSVGGLEVNLQFNPGRIVSTSAKVDAASIKQRKCFLCRDNRPAEQISLKFEGRKGKKYDILVNPYPIFPEHLVIAMDRHCDQSVWKRYVDVLDLAKTYPRYVFMYNGPKCGASAPDHHHFQAARRGLMPLERDVDALLDALSPTLEYLTSVKEAELFHYHKFTSGIFVLRARTVKSMAKLFYRLADCAPAVQGEEPMMNLLVWHAGGEYRSVVMFRQRHRPLKYYEEGPQRLMLSPGCADMAGFFVMPRKEDFDRMTPELLSEVLSEVSLSPEDEQLMKWRLTRTQPRISVGLMAAKEIEFEILSDGAGVRKALWKDGKIEYDGALYDELWFDEQTLSTMFAEPTFVLHGVTIGVGFHWERKEKQKFAGALKIIVVGDKLQAINVIGVEDYLLSVISSEMKSTSSPEFLKAHAVISRSWVMSMMARRNVGADVGKATGADARTANARKVVATVDPKEGYIKWYDREDHSDFDVCADDHCQRYQGLTRATGEAVRQAVDSTWGEVLASEGALCDARFSKCCGGVTERFSTCWEDKDYPYLRPVADMPSGSGPSRQGGDSMMGGPFAGLDLSKEDDARRWITDPAGTGAAAAYCSTSDSGVLSQVLNDYDRETPDFFRWEVRYSRAELSALVERRSGKFLGLILDLKPLHRGPSGRIDLLKIVGTEGSLTVGKELEIRKMLSESHLKSSAFVADWFSSDGKPLQPPAPDDGKSSGTDVVPAGMDIVVLKGAGWGHGVGLCQIGAAVMASEGASYREILSAYYPTAEILDMTEVMKL